MPVFPLLMIVVGSFIIILLIIVLVTQIKSSRQLEKLRKGVLTEEESKKEAAERTGAPSQARAAKRESAVEAVPDVTEIEKTVLEQPAEEAVPAPIVPEEVVPVEEAMPPETAEIAVEIPSPLEEPVEETVEAAAEAAVPSEAAFEAKPYPEFNNARAVEQLGLSQEEADMFISELVTQIDEELPNLDAAIAAHDVEQVERLSHKLKGSATSLGEGGVADVLVDFNTYCKDGDDAEVMQAHMNNLKYYYERLKEQFPA
ncbi:MAG: Hpt domain-containing protein [Campylobacterales bacterium]|jgi:hypothetical protein